MFEIVHPERTADPANLTDPVGPESAAFAGVGEFVLATLEQLCDGNSGAIGFQSALFDLNVDSIVLVSLIARAEISFGVELAAEEAAQLLVAQSVGELTRVLAGIVARRSPPAP
jgi:acyl carrier protein